MDVCHYNYLSSLIYHYNLSYWNYAIIILQLFQTHHYLSFRCISKKFWTKMPSSSSSHPLSHLSPLLCLSMSWPPPVLCRARASTTRPPPSLALRVCDRRSSGGHLAALVVLLGRTPHIRVRRSGPTAKRRRASMAGEAARGRARTRGLGHPLSSTCWSSTPTAERPPGHRRSRTVAARPGPAGRPPRSPQSGCTPTATAGSRRSRRRRR